MMELIFFPISFFFLLISTYTDLRNRMIPNVFTYSMIAIGILGHLYLAVTQNNFSIFLITIGITIATFGVSWLLWKQGVWAGGDVKLFTGLAALNPWNLVFFPKLLNYSFFLGNQNLFSAISIPVFPLTLFIFSVLSTIPYTSLLSTQKILFDSTVREEFASKIKNRIPKTIVFSIALFGAVSALNQAGMQGLWFGAALFAGMFLFGILFLKNKMIAILLSLALAAYSISRIGIRAGMMNIVWVFAGILIVEFFVELYRMSRKYVLRKTVLVPELKEGDIPVHSLIERNGKIEKEEGLSIQKVLKSASENDLANLMAVLTPSGRMIVNAKQAAGLEESQVQELKKLAQEGKIEEKIDIKLSAPFAPAILLAYVIVNVIGDAIWILLF